MGFLTPRRVDRPHICDQPSSPNAHAEGTRWQCDDCGAIHCVEQRMDRGSPECQWVLEQPAAPKPKCNAPIKRCAMAGEHHPVCRCVLDAGHDAGHLSRH